MANGIRTDTLQSVPLSDAVLVNRDKSTGQQSTRDLANQLARSGGIAERFDDIEKQVPALEARTGTLEGTASDHEGRVSTLENMTYAEAIPYASTSDGLADTVEGQRFKVDNDDPDIAYDVYSHETGGVATFKSSQPSVAGLSQKVDQSDFDAARDKIDDLETSKADVEVQKTYLGFETDENQSAVVIADEQGDAALIAGERSFKTKQITITADEISHPKIMALTVGVEEHQVKIVDLMNRQSVSDGGYPGASSQTTTFQIVDDAGNPAISVSPDRILHPAIQALEADVEALNSGSAETEGALTADLEDSSSGVNYGFEIAGDTGTVLSADPSQSSLGHFYAGISEVSDDDDVLQITDTAGNVAVSIGQDSFATSTFSVTKTTIIHPVIQTIQEDLAALGDNQGGSDTVIVDEDDYYPASEVVQIILYGQSLSNGTSTGGATSETPVDFGLMFNGGVNWNKWGNGAAALESINTEALITAAHTSLVSLEEGVGNSNGETPAYGLAQMMQELAVENGHSFDADGQTVLMSAPGIGGASVAQLSTDPWLGYVETDIEQAKSLCDASGETVTLGAMPIIQGESNTNTDPNIWMQGWRDIKASVLAKAQATMGTSHDLVTPIYQMAQAGNTAEAQLKLANEDGWCLATPIYWLEKVADGTHLTAQSSKWMGAYFGKAIYEWLWLGVRPTMLTPSQITRVGTSLAVKFPVKESNKLVFDTGQLPQAHNYGFQILDGASELTITRVALAGRDTVILATDGGVPDGAVLRYGYNGDGTTKTENLRSSTFGNLRDNDPLVFDPSTLALPMYQWVPTFKMEID